MRQIVLDTGLGGQKVLLWCPGGNRPPHEAGRPRPGPSRAPGPGPPVRRHRWLGALLAWASWLLPGYAMDLLLAHLHP